jgi:4-amino-4-deoxy-L-arabinose transferase-like glycosyltransferase
MSNAHPSSPLEVLIRYRIWVLLALAFLAYIPTLDLRDMWYPDEPDIAEVCQAMYNSGDWISPRRIGVIWVDYPPMIYWTATIASHLLGGVSEFSLRLPTALAGILLVLLTCAVVSRWVNRWAGLVAGLMLLTFTQFVYNAVSYRPDIQFSLMVTVGMFVYAAGAGNRPRWWMKAAGFAFFGLAMLSKGPLGLLLPGLVLTLWHGARREWRSILWLAPLSLVALAVYLPWFVACAKAMGSDNILHELFAQNIERFYAAKRGHEKPVYYYAGKIWLDLAPWSPLLPFALWSIYRRKLWHDRHVQLVLWWLGTFFIFLSMAVTKRQLYMIPAYPAAAMIMAMFIAPPSPRPDANEAGGTNRVLNIFISAVAFLLLLLGAAALIGVVGFTPIVSRFTLDAHQSQVVHGLRLPVAVICVALFASAWWIGRAWRREHIHAGILRVGVGHVVLYGLVLGLAAPAMNPTKSYKPQCEWIRAQIGDSTRIGLINPRRGYHKRGAFGFYTHTLVDLLKTPEEVEAFFERHPRSVVLVQDKATASIYAGHEAAWRARVIGRLQTGKYRYEVVKAAPAGTDK